MGGSIFLEQGDKLVEMKEAPYEAEAILQKLLANYPSLLAGDQMDGASPRRWLLVTREMGVPAEDQGAKHFALDHLFLDQDGIPTLVEVKRSVNREIRRQIVGQMLDYAANGVAHWTVEHIHDAWEAACNEQPADEVLEDHLQGESAPEEFWEAVKTNLEAGKIRMVFVADEIPPELLRIVQFLSKQMDPAQVFALEVRQFAGEGQTTLVPRIVGQMVVKTRAGDSGKVWEPDSFLEGIGEADQPVVDKILEWASSQRLEVYYGQGSIVGRVAVTDHHRPFYFFRIGTNGKVNIPFKRFKDRPPFDQDSKREDLRVRLNRIPGISLADADKYPSFPLALLKDENALKEFLATIESVRHETAPS